MGIVFPAWEGKEFIQEEPVTSHALELFTDASTVGFGAVFGDNWFYSAWPPHLIEKHINFLELFAIGAALFTWGHAWINKQIIFFSHNSCIAHVWCTGACSNKYIMKLVRASLFKSYEHMGSKKDKVNNRKGISI